MTQMNWLILALVSVLAFDKAYAAIPSASDVLIRLDSAQTAADFKTTVASLKQLGGEAIEVLESYAMNPTKEARNRMLVLRFVLDKRTPTAASKTVQDLIRNSSDENFIALCAEELGRRPSPEGKALLKGLLDNPDESAHVQVAAALGLAEMGDSSGKDRALKAVLQKEPWSNTAIRALEKLQAKDAITRIDQAARSSENPHDKSVANIAALRIQLAGRPNSEQLDILEKALRDKDSREVRKWAAMRLAEIGTPEAGQRLAAVAKSGNSDFASSASRGLRVGVDRKTWTKDDVMTWMGGREKHND